MDCDKLEFGGLKARGILSPSGRHTHSEWWSCVSSETTRKRKKRSEPRRQEWAAACHGVGRKPGDGKALYQYIASLSVTPTCVGVPVSFWVVRVVPPATLPRVALHHSLWVCRPFHGLGIPLACARQLPDKFQFIGIFSMPGMCVRWGCFPETPAEAGQDDTQPAEAE